MALFKILRGTSGNFSDGTTSDFNPEFHDGWCYYLTDTQEFYIDYQDENGKRYREPIGAQKVQMIDWEEKEMINFYISDEIEIYDELYALSCEKGMTWYDFIMSKYNPDVSNSFTDEMIIQNKLFSAFKPNGPVQIWTSDELYENGLTLYNNEFNSVSVNREIIPEMIYYTE